MTRLRTHSESHLSSRIGWLRAAVLGANDGIISTASLIMGVAAATPNRTAILIAGVAGLTAGALSMAAGEYAVSHLAGGSIGRNGFSGKGVSSAQAVVTARIDKAYATRACPMSAI
jgi:VIT1/CCC1 family predicted Fe2+/Mn2+ transporter